MLLIASNGHIVILIHLYFWLELFVSVRFDNRPRNLQEKQIYSNQFNSMAAYACLRHLYVSGNRESKHGWRNRRRKGRGESRRIIWSTTLVCGSLRFSFHNILILIVREGLSRRFFFSDCLLHAQIPAKRILPLIFILPHINPWRQCRA